MPYKSKQEGGVSKGKPSQTEKDKAATKEVDNKKGIVYQIYPRSFMDSNGDGVGDLPGIV